jgi:hypothetical protein
VDGAFCDEPTGVGSVVTTMTIAKRQLSSSSLWRIAGAIFLLAGLSLLTACAGVTNGPAHFTTTTTGQLTVAPATLAFGSVLNGSSATASGTLTARTASVVVSAVSSSNSLFSVGGLTLPVTLAAGQSVTFTVTFSPRTSGAVTGTLTFNSNAQPSTTVETVTGTGSSSTTTNGQLTVSPATLALGNVVDGSSGAASGILIASNGSVTVSAASSNNSVFSVGGLSLPATIAAGQSIPFTVTFSPQTPGAVSATLTFTNSGQPSTAVEILTGTGTSSNILGYNIYRATQSGSCGSFSKINAVLNTGTLYTDAAVASGTTYCYAATAVNTSSEESSYSNIDSNVQIP